MGVRESDVRGMEDLCGRGSGQAGPGKQVQAVSGLGQGDRKPLRLLTRVNGRVWIALAQSPMLLMEDEQKRGQGRGWADRMLMPEWTRYAELKLRKI